MSEVEWKQLVDYPEYAASNEGYVMRLVDGVKYKQYEIVMPQQLANGYLTVQLYPSRDIKYIHRLVAEAFLGACPAEHEVHHKDGKKTNNALANLVYVSKQEHLKDNILKNSHVGSSNPMAALTEEKVVLIKEALATGVPGKTVAELFNISIALVSMIKNGKRWAHVTIQFPIE